VRSAVLPVLCLLPAEMHIKVLKPQEGDEEASTLQKWVEQGACVCSLLRALADTLCQTHHKFLDYNTVFGLCFSSHIVL
jgi:hypothetical protein